MLPPHPDDALPPNASVRLDTTRFCHLPVAGDPGVNALAFSPDGSTLAALGYQDDRIALWEVPTGGLLRKWEADQADRFGRLQFSPDGQFLAMASHSGVSLWNPHTGSLVRRLVEETERRYPLFSDVAFSPDGRLLAASLRFDCVVVVWKVGTGQLLTCLKVPTPPDWPNDMGEGPPTTLLSVAFSPDGRRVAGGGAYKVCYYPNDPNAEAIRARIGRRPVGRLNMALDSKHTLVVERGGVWCWDLDSDRIRANWNAHEERVAHLHFLGDGRLVCGSEDGGVRVWDVEAGGRTVELATGVGRELPAVITIPPVSEVWVTATALRFTPDGRLLVARTWVPGGEEEPGPTMLRVFDATAGQEVWATEPGPRGVHAADFAPDGRTLATDMGDGTTLLWQMPDAFTKIADEG
jgi:WD40 repeat protein